jgi:phosphate transport system permease protein
MTAIPRASRLRGGETSQIPDRVFRWSTGSFAFGVVIILVAIFILLAIESAEAFRTFGIIPFVTGTTWDPVAGIYGAWPYIVGTLASSAIALILAAPVAIFAAIYLSEWAPRRAAAPLTFVIELLAAIPSVVIGLWGIFILGPVLKATVGTVLNDALGWMPLFSGPVFSTGLYVAGIILAIMILPTIITISREVITAVPQSQREAMLALGATRWETVRTAVLPSARSGIVGAVILGLGRALGETMAVTMVIGNGQDVPTSIFSQANSIASKIATTFNEAQVGLNTSALIALGVILLVITVLLNIAARLLVWRAEGR